MKFGFDIDDTLIDLRGYAFQLYNQKLNQNVSLDVLQTINTLEIHKAFGLTGEEGGKLWNSLADEIYYSGCPIFEGALDMLQKLDREGHEIFYITARKKEHSERTKQWLIKHGFPFREDHFYCGMKDQEKIEIILDLQLDYYFDDKPAVLETLLEIPTKVYAKDNPYNQKVKVPRLKDWSELKDILAQ
ncbi:HAD family acid phosphatase [Bacillus sp. JJ634]